MQNAPQIERQKLTKGWNNLVESYREPSFENLEGNKEPIYESVILRLLIVPS